MKEVSSGSPGAWPDSEAIQGHISKITGLLDKVQHCIDRQKSITHVDRAKDPPHEALEVCKKDAEDFGAKCTDDASISDSDESSDVSSWSDSPRSGYCPVR